MYQIFEIKLRRKEIDLREKLDEINKLGWHSNGRNLTKTDGWLQYILDLSHFSVKCLVVELFPIEEGNWLPENYPSREEIVRIVITELEKLPFNLEIDEIQRTVKHEG
jgi:hypothetical protein